MLNVLPELPAGDCCAEAWGIACAAGELDPATDWICPDCGELWQPETVGAVRLWRMRPFIAIIRP